MKIFRKNDLCNDKIKIILMEAMILKSFDHPNILKLHSMYEDRKHIFLVTEFFAVNLLEYMNYFYKCFTETHLKEIFK